MTLKKKKILEIESTSARWHSVESSLWKRLWTCRKTDCGMNDSTIWRSVSFKNAVVENMN